MGRKKNILPTKCSFERLAESRELELDPNYVYQLPPPDRDWDDFIGIKKGRWAPFVLVFRPNNGEVYSLFDRHCSSNNCHFFRRPAGAVSFSLPEIQKGISGWKYGQPRWHGREGKRNEMSKTS